MFIQNTFISPSFHVLSFTVSGRRCAARVLRSLRSTVGLCVPPFNGLYCSQARSRDNSTRAHTQSEERQREKGERERQPVYQVISITTEQRGWNTGHPPASIRGKIPPRLPPPHMKTQWRTGRRQTRVNSPKTRSRRFGCRVKMAYLKNTFLKERVRMTTWRQLVASVRRPISLLASCVSTDNSSVVVWCVCVFDSGRTDRPTTQFVLIRPTMCATF